VSQVSDHPFHRQIGWKSLGSSFYHQHRVPRVRVFGPGIAHSSTCHCHPERSRSSGGAKDLRLFLFLPLFCNRARLQPCRKGAEKVSELHPLRQQFRIGSCGLPTNLGAPFMRGLFAHGWGQVPQVSGCPFHHQHRVPQVSRIWRPGIAHPSTCHCHPERSRSSRGAKDLRLFLFCCCFVTGHDFSRAARSRKSLPASAPAATIFDERLAQVFSKFVPPPKLGAPGLPHLETWDSTPINLAVSS
jgi:hypothetical protein